MSDAIAQIPDNARVYCSGATAVPLALLRAMADDHGRWSRLDLVADYLIEPIAVFEHPGAPFFITSLQPNGALKPMMDGGAYTSAASPLSTWASQMAPGSPLAIDVALIHVSPPGPDGRFSLGVNTVATLDAMLAADLVVAQVNPQMPYTFGASELERDEIDLLVEADHPLAEFPPVHGNDTTEAIGTLIAAQIADGSWLQLGLGAVPDVLCRELQGHKNLGLHSGMIADGVIELAESGALTGADHPVFPGKIVTAGIFGTKRLFDWVDGNPDVVMVPPTITHGLDALAPLPNFCAVNSAIEVALDGSINSERVGDRVVSGPGGAPDYAAIVAAIDTARFFVGLPSTAARGTRSRIVESLQAPATVPGTQVDTVVTEFGLADLRGRTGAERSAALWSIAHPDFRPAPR